MCHHPEILLCPINHIHLGVIGHRPTVSPWAHHYLHQSNSQVLSDPPFSNFVSVSILYTPCVLPYSSLPSSLVCACLSIFSLHTAIGISPFSSCWSFCCCCVLICSVFQLFQEPDYMYIKHRCVHTSISNKEAMKPTCVWWCIPTNITGAHKFLFFICAVTLKGE